VLPQVRTPRRRVGAVLGYCLISGKGVRKDLVEAARPPSGSHRSWNNHTTVLAEDGVVLTFGYNYYWLLGRDDWRRGGAVGLDAREHCGLQLPCTRLRENGA
jgi:hypothetical protein